MLDNKEFQTALIKILNTLVTKQPSTSQRYLLDTVAKEQWGPLVYKDIILAHSYIPATLILLTQARVEARSSQSTSYLCAIERMIYAKETVSWFVDAIFYPTLQSSSSRQNYTDGRQFTSSEEETFPKNLLSALSEFRSRSEITEAIDATQTKQYDCYQDRAQAIRKELNIA